MFNGQTGSSNGDIPNTEESRSEGRKNSTMSKGSSKGKLCGKLQTNNLSSVYVEIIYRYYFRAYVLFHGKRKLTSRGAKGLQEEKEGNEGSATDRQTILKDCRKRRTNLAMAWIDYRKAYDFVLYSWTLECLDMLDIADNVRSFFEKSMKKWNLLLNSNGSELCEVDVNRSIFQGISCHH